MRAITVLASQSSTTLNARFTLDVLMSDGQAHLLRVDDHSGNRALLRAETAGMTTSLTGYPESERAWRTLR